MNAHLEYSTAHGSKITEMADFRCADSRKDTRLADRISERAQPLVECVGAREHMHTKVYPIAYTGQGWQMVARAPLIHLHFPVDRRAPTNSRMFAPRCGICRGSQGWNRPAINRVSD